MAPAATLEMNQYMFPFGPHGSQVDHTGLHYAQTATAGHHVPASMYPGLPPSTLPYFGAGTPVMYPMDVSAIPAMRHVSANGVTWGGGAIPGLPWDQSMPVQPASVARSQQAQAPSANSAGPGIRPSGYGGASSASQPKATPTEVFTAEQRRQFKAQQLCLASFRMGSIPSVMDISPALGLTGSSSNDPKHKEMVAKKLLMLKEKVLELTQQHSASRRDDSSAEGSRGQRPPSGGAASSGGTGASHEDSSEEEEEDEDGDDDDAEEAGGQAQLPPPQQRMQPSQGPLRPQQRPQQHYQLHPQQQPRQQQQMPSATPRSSTQQAQAVQRQQQVGAASKAGVGAFKGQEAQVTAAVSLPTQPSLGQVAPSSLASSSQGVPAMKVTRADTSAASSGQSDAFSAEQMRQMQGQVLCLTSFGAGMKPDKPMLASALGLTNSPDADRKHVEQLCRNLQAPGMAIQQVVGSRLTDLNADDEAEPAQVAPNAPLEEKLAAAIAAKKRSLKQLLGSPSVEDEAKTRAVIQLRKLQLVHMQRRMRRDLLRETFEPQLRDWTVFRIQKRVRPSRKWKGLERLEKQRQEARRTRMKEQTRQFMKNLAQHELLLREGWMRASEHRSAANRYVRDFHRRHERAAREAAERSRRERLQALRSNDVEQYLALVKDEKNGRIQLLLKQTESYLAELSAKLGQYKAGGAKRAGGGGGKSETVVEGDDPFVEDEVKAPTTIAEHFKDSNDKYYAMAHTVDESVEQPSILVGGNLRTYQLLGLRWMVSLYNNKLNGILADEMGLGKTIQIIALLCYLLEKKEDRGPYMIVVPSSVIPNWISEFRKWAPSIRFVTYAGNPDDRKRLFHQHMRKGAGQQDFHVLITTYEFLMQRNDRIRLATITWQYIIIDEGHRIKNAECKLNAALKFYSCRHRLLLTGTPIQNNLDELWTLLNFLLPTVFNSSVAFSEWFNKPFESLAAGGPPPDGTELGDEENLLIINRLHQVLRPFMLRRMKEKVEHELPSKTEILLRCHQSGYQRELARRVATKAGAMLATGKARAIQNTVLELRKICNHPFLSYLHSERVEELAPPHYLSPLVHMCGKMELLDRLLPKLRSTGHKVLFFCTMTRLLDLMEEYLGAQGHKFLRLDGTTSGAERGELIRQFNSPAEDVFIFLLSIRAGGLGINLQTADTVIIYDTDWNPQIDLQAQARAHRIGQKNEVLVLRLETTGTVEEKVRATAESKLDVANQSITAGFFDNTTSVEDRKRYLETLLQEAANGREGSEDESVKSDEEINALIARRWGRVVPEL
eukprot:jgi/Mesvir1/24064/Mv10789-RA.3